METSRPVGRGLWSPIALAGRPTVLVVDASQNVEGWEAEACRRMFASIQRRHLRVAAPGVVYAIRPDDLAPYAERHASFNTLLLCCHGGGAGVPPEAGLAGYWTWLDAHLPRMSKLFVACTWDPYDAEASKAVLGGRVSFAAIALAPHSPMAPREASLFFLKFLTELDLHSERDVTGRMVWFAASKARELLRRRNLPGKVGVRC